MTHVDFLGACHAWRRHGLLLLSIHSAHLRALLHAAGGASALASLLRFASSIATLPHSRHHATTSTNNAAATATAPRIPAGDAIVIDVAASLDRTLGLPATAGTAHSAVSAVATGDCSTRTTIAVAAAANAALPTVAAQPPPLPSFVVPLLRAVHNLSGDEVGARAFLAAGAAAPLLRLFRTTVALPPERPSAPHPDGEQEDGRPATDNLTLTSHPLCIDVIRARRLALLLNVLANLVAVSVVDLAAVTPPLAGGSDRSDHGFSDVLDHALYLVRPALTGLAPLPGSGFTNQPPAEATVAAAGILTARVSDRVALSVELLAALLRFAGNAVAAAHGRWADGHSRGGPPVGAASTSDTTTLPNSCANNAAISQPQGQREDRTFAASGSIGGCAVAIPPQLQRRWRHIEEVARIVVMEVLCVGRATLAALLIQWPEDGRKLVAEICRSAGSHAP